MKPRTMALIAAMAMFAALAVPIELAAQAQIRYSLLDLGTIGGTFSLGAGVNNRAWVSGFSTVAGDQQTHAALWVHGRKIDLGTLGGPNSAAFFGPDERGWVVGRAETSTPDPFGQDACFFGTFLTCMPFIWQNGVMTALSTLGGSFGTGFDVNNRGQVVGVAAIATPDPTCAPPFVLGFKPVLWEEGQIQQLATVFGDPDGFADGINDKGQAVGGTGNCAPTVQGQTNHAVLWQNGTAVDLGNLGGTTNNLATDINNQGQVVGKSNVSGDAAAHAFLWQNGTMTDLGTLAGDFASQANAINNKGQLVGFSCDASGNCRAFLWKDGVMNDLNTFTPAHSPLYALDAIGINAGGMITGYALQLSTGQIHAFLATPTTDDVADAATLGVRGEGSESSKITVPENVRKLVQQRSGLGRANLGVTHSQ
jgi:probable HAF family extracellular repeat protein